MRLIAAILVATFAVLTARADDARAERAADLARIHLEAVGGRARLEALAAMRAHGQVIVGDRRIRFTMVAARPNLMRLETQNGTRSLIQATDGIEPPWEFDTGTWPPRYRAMAESAARTFAADAEFDDPLIAGAARGYQLSYAGETDVAGRMFLRVLVKRGESESHTLLLDPDTYLIAMRVEVRQTPSGQRVQIVTQFEDFRPVQGVLLPHDVIVAVDGKVTQQTKIERIEPNPLLSPDTFRRPRPQTGG